MSAFKDSGHHWWQQCPACGMAWFIGDAPEDEDEEVECSRCRNIDSVLASARAEGYAEAKAQAEEIASNMAHNCAVIARGMQTDVMRGQWRKAHEVSDDIAQTIRAMKPESK